MEPTLLLDNLAFPESPRWHEDRLWVSDWGAQELITLDLEGKREVAAQVRAFLSAQLSFLTANASLWLETKFSAWERTGHCSRTPTWGCSRVRAGTKSSQMDGVTSTSTGAVTVLPVSLGLSC